MYKPFNKFFMADNNSNNSSKKNKGFGPQKPDGDFDWSKINLYLAGVQLLLQQLF